MSDDPNPAATLVVVHDRVGQSPELPPELLMVERASGMAFAGPFTVLAAAAPQSILTLAPNLTTSAARRRFRWHCPR